MGHYQPNRVGYAKRRPLVGKRWKLLIFLACFSLFFVGVPVSVLLSYTPVFAPHPSSSPEDTILVWVTAYSSSPDETNYDPFITAAQTIVRDGVIAANFLPMGTLVKIPELFGEKVFVVEDRLHPRKKWVVDIWMPSKEDAKEFGAHLTKIHVLESPSRKTAASR